MNLPLSEQRLLSRDGLDPVEALAAPRARCGRLDCDHGIVARGLAHEQRPEFQRRPPAAGTELGAPVGERDPVGPGREIGFAERRQDPTPIDSSEPNRRERPEDGSLFL